MEGGESVIWGVAVHPCGQEVGVMVADPGYLHQIEIRLFSEKNFSIYAPFCLFHPTDTNILFNWLFSCFFVQFVIQMSQPVSGWHRIIDNDHPSH